MARYDYKCPACELVFEVEHGMDEKPLIVCPSCGHEAARVFEASGISLKGSGFYNTDMRDSSPRRTAEKVKESVEKASSSEGASSPSDASAAKTDAAAPSKTSESTSSGTASSD